MMKLEAIFAIMTVVATGAYARAEGMSCEGLAKLKLPNTEITSATLVDKGAFTPPAMQPMALPPPAPAVPGAPAAPQGQAGPAAPAPGPGPGSQNSIYKTLPSFCRVEASLHPSPDSDIKIEVWLPAVEWTGRLAAFGNGGFQSSIGYNNLAQAVSKGYAGTANNTGHTGNNGDSLIGHPEKVIDWGYRAVHEDVVAAKAIAAAFYGSAPKYSYYNGCSTGGRQGWVAAEYYPNDFDGLAIGDPANPMTRLQAAVLWSTLLLNKDPADSIVGDKWNMIRDAVMKQCDAVDGLKDGLIEDPMACHFDVRSLVCKDGASADCLTSAQVDTLTKFLHGAVNSRTGEQIFPGFPVGSQMVPGPFAGGPSPSLVDAVDTFRVLYQKSDWDYHTMDFDKDIALSDKLGNNTMNAVDPSRLKPLFGRGGKVLLYHGWNDGAITPLLSIQLYQQAVEANGGLGKTYNDVRLFMVPGMGHCGGGIGPNAFDKLDAISDWVEKGKAPDQIIASHSDSPGHVDRTRPLCPYPQIAKYKGNGSIDDAQNFACAKP